MLPPLLERISERFEGRQQHLAVDRTREFLIGRIGIVEAHRRTGSMWGGSEMDYLSRQNGCRVRREQQP
jgi:hypothetical protein